jgi:hypothetical protein
MHKRAIAGECEKGLPHKDRVQGSCMRKDRHRRVVCIDQLPLLLFKTLCVQGVSRKCSHPICPHFSCTTRTALYIAVSVPFTDMAAEADRLAMPPPAPRLAQGSSSSKVRETLAMGPSCCMPQPSAHTYMLYHSITFPYA